MAKTWLVTDEFGESAVTIVEDDGQQATVEIDGQRLSVTTQTLPDGQVAVHIDGGKAQTYRSWTDHRGTWVSSGPVANVFAIESEQQRLLGALLAVYESAR